VTVDDRELMADIRFKLHGVALMAGRISNRPVATELEVRIDTIIDWLRDLSGSNKHHSKSGG
jgi:hypothetical protein